MNNNIKISGRYGLAFVHPEYVDKHHSIFITCDSRTGEPVFPYNKKEGTTLEHLDYFILEHIKNEKQLRSFVTDLGYHIPDYYEPYITYQSQNGTKFLEPIYHNQTLYEMLHLTNGYKSLWTAYARLEKWGKQKLQNQISDEISQDTEWLLFFDGIMQKIHIPEFYDYLKKDKMLDCYILDYMDQCLNSENSIAKKQSIEKLKTIFTNYKSIRSFLISFEKYQEQKEIQLSKEETKQKVQIQPLSEQQLSFVDAFSIPWYQKTNEQLTEEEIAYLEKHEYFEQLSEDEKIEFVNRILSPDTKSPYQKKKI